MVQHLLAPDRLEEALQLLLGVGVGGRRLDVARVEGEHEFRPVEGHLKGFLSAAAVDDGEGVDGEELDVHPGGGEVDDAVSELEVVAGEAVFRE